MGGFVTKKPFLAALLLPAILMVAGAEQAAGDYEQTVLADNPVAYWRLNEPSGTTAFNRASAAYPHPSNPLNGTYNGGVTLDIAGAIVGDAAAAFNPGQYMSVPNQPALNVTEVSVEAWIKSANLPPENGSFIASIVTKGDFAYRLQLDSRTDPAWQVALGLTSLDSNGQQINFIDLYGPVPSPNVWTHVVGTYDGSTARLYVNGVLVNSASYTTGLGIDSYPLAIGENLQEERMGRFFNGGIDEVALYDYPLSAEQVAAHYAAGALTSLLDHFKCYKAKGEPPNVAVDLEDQFGAVSDVLVRKPEFFCNPVDKNGEGIRNPVAHLTCYQIKADGEKRDVVITNQFGEQTLEVKKPELLCVPSNKSVP